MRPVWSCQGPESSPAQAPAQTAVQAQWAAVWPRPQWMRRTEHWSSAALPPHPCLKMQINKYIFLLYLIVLM